MSDTSTTDIIGKAATTAAVSGAVMEAMYRGQDVAMQGTVGRMLGRAPIWAAGAVAGGLSSVSADMFHDVVVPHISKSERFANLSSGAVGAMTAAGSSAASFYLLDPTFLTERGVGVVPIMATGVAAEIIGGYAWNEYLKPAMGLAEDPTVVDLTGGVVG